MKLPKASQKLVVFGGGTGLSNLLRGLIQFNQPSMITAVPSGWDDGGSSGRLRDEMGTLPPGDARQCLLACMESAEQKEVAQKLFDDRLADIEGPFKGHSVGNLITARLERLFAGQDRGLEAARKLFRVQVNILPATLTDLRLIARTQGGLEIQGETNIDNRRLRKDFNPKDPIVRIFFNTQAKANQEVVKKILEAQKIIFSAGDLYTSILPHLLIEGVQEAIAKSKAKVILVLNLMTKRGETDFYKASNHLESFLDYLVDHNRLDVMIASSNDLNPKVLKIYHEDGQEPVEIDRDRCLEIVPSIKIIQKPLAKYLNNAHLLRHDSKLLAKTILSL
ncbi:hypothetical protein A2631_00275 [Candidatus Daviesbacteria bacterium RIFCSPHIGHO2_01_FULL_44_29]|uniref:Gluconeogenesis factor n=1 Tax=Candidatus Daviesbacteria bacterium RIFCSPHIGHO2_02_FULL_43_12 TaxID=1797776 RepID=A0A1F5KFR1_9BACT|nr:MAG: hypothetical protein A2631_00275 [Candidatus Daviesbacteria bacterium RIFCSPHIGHO2_01_FULL_44_29]OGE39777.1 MAG: hypothetical protein A3D25_03565 [Candidatus Daviesbacteria bacterium RIFCSPHIGHO2_02_FULL_43_12]OGE69932.1 MAG: hypothetical protein A3B55_04520 [Candidatus Daviesbacteria bacterium RIFCSPLOWO2_01_FULL_43_15]